MATLNHNRASSTGERLARWAYQLVAVPIVFAVALLVFATVGPRHVPDDAFIVLVYVRHLIEHGSIFWNATEGHVDGCTSMLDLLAKTLVQAVTRGRDLATMNWAFTVVGFLGVAVLGTGYFGRLARERARPFAWLVAAAACLAVGAHRASLEGAKFLLETPLYLLTVLGTIALVTFVERWTTGRLVGLGLACTLMLLARPEAIVIVGLLLFYFVVTHRAELAPRARLLPAAIAVGCFGAYVLWHTIYFGSWAPNTYYAKKSASRLLELEDGYQYVKTYCWATWGKVAIGSTLIAPLVALARPWSAPKYRWLALTVAIAGVLNLASIVVAGGDCYFGWGRFLGCCSVLSIVALAIGAMHVTSVWRWLALAPIVALALGNVRAATATPLPKKLARIQQEWPFQSNMMACDIEAMRALKGLGITSFAQTDQQRFKYFDDDLTVVDASGLNDRIAAHTTTNARVRFGKGGVTHAVARNAEAFSYGAAFPYHTQPMASYSSRELVFDDALRDRYMMSFFDESYPEKGSGPLLYERFRPASVRACTQWFNFWLRNDVAARLEGRADILVGPRDPSHVVSLDDTPNVHFEAWGPHGPLPMGTGRYLRGTAKIVFAEGSWGASPPCSLGFQLGMWPQPYQLTLDGKPLLETALVHRFDVSKAFTTPGPHELVVTSPGGVMLTGLSFEPCNTGR